STSAAVVSVSEVFASSALGHLGALKNDLLATKSVPEDETDARILKLKESLKFLEEELKDLKTGGRVEDAQAGPTSMDQAAVSLYLSC
ncbi:hypothetical protein PQX77_021947, partial [Marasmius sp. AFHP31]